MCFPPFVLSFVCASPAGTSHSHPPAHSVFIIASKALINHATSNARPGAGTGAGAAAKAIPGTQIMEAHCPHMSVTRRRTKIPENCVV